MKGNHKNLGHGFDSVIAAAIQQRFKLDSDVPDERITIHVHQGLVTLYGTVDARLQKEAAESGAHKVKGVRGVTNRIHV